MTKVKICGITNLEDARLAAKFGADALGFNFYKQSPRHISPEKARKIIEELPGNILKVGIFVNEDLEKIVATASIAKLDALQLHGEETPEFARKLKAKTNLEIIKAFRVSPEFMPEDVLHYEVDTILLDAYNTNKHGGTGETFDWEIAKRVQEIFPKMYLAGGLSADNVSRAIGEIKPFGVDSCSCLEIEKGKKDKVKLINFLCNVVFLRKYLSGSEKVNIVFHLRLLHSRPKWSERKFYLIQKSISQLCAYIYGYQVALGLAPEAEENLEILKTFEEYEEIERERFEPFLDKFAEHFLRLTDGNEERAFELFFARLEEFLSEEKNIVNE